MDPHISTPPRPLTLQWKVGKPATPWSLILFLCFLLAAAVLFLVVAGQTAATHRAIHACDTGHMTCRVSMGYTRAHVLAEDAAEDQTVCGDGWRSCVDAASEGNIQ
jgi:hypothetical protein